MITKTNTLSLEISVWLHFLEIICKYFYLFLNLCVYIYICRSKTLDMLIILLNIFLGNHKTHVAHEYGCNNNNINYYYHYFDTIISVREISGKKYIYACECLFNVTP